MRLFRLRMFFSFALILALSVIRGSAQDISVTHRENIQTVIEYDADLDCYFLHKRINNVDIALPQKLTAAEYLAWKAKQSTIQYFKKRQNEDKTAASDSKPFGFMNQRYNVSQADRIFGSGGIKLSMRGSTEIKTGITHTRVNNPSLPENQRNTWGFDFDNSIDANVHATVGDRLDFNLNYNTEASFDVDAKDLKLKYEGKEDEIIKLLEAGNVSLASENSLIRGSSALFGIRADMQFGKFNMQTVVSQQQSSKKTISSKGGIQTKSFEICASDYESDQHFFLAHYFRDNYEKSLSQLPNITSGIQINRIEVWVTNRKGAYENTRNILALADLGEGPHAFNTHWKSSTAYPSNISNSLYTALNSTYQDCRDISQVQSVLSECDGMEGGNDYEKLEAARMLSSNEYTLNTRLGYISLHTSLQADEILAVAFEYTFNGKSYQVGEFSSDLQDATKTLYVKLLKSTNSGPASAVWPLMMKNVYTLNASSIQKEKFQMYITYQNDTLGTNLRYLSEGRIASKPLISVMGLDRLNSQDKAYPDGNFDFVDGYTILAQEGRIFLPSVEPFGRYLRKQIGNDVLADKYIFQALYDSTQTVARQKAEYNKFYLVGEFQAASVNEINVGTNISAGSLHVTAGSTELVENTDYVVDYMTGIVTIINQSIINAGTSVEVEVEGSDDFGLERKTMMGTNMSYDINDKLRIGGTLMRLSEHALTSKVNMNEEPLSNTLWGLNLNWKSEWRWLTRMLNKLPFSEFTAPSSINLNLEYAQLIASHGGGMQQDASYVDNFENAESTIDLRQPSYWVLASTPYNNSANALFPEAGRSNDISYGKNRALLAWYHVDPILNRRNNSLMPEHLKIDTKQQSNHYVREVYEQEIFPNRETDYQETAAMNVLNLAYYPSKRGPYNLDTNLNSDGTLRNPASRWGGMMRRLDTSDFEAANIEYITFWMLDPFLYDTNGNLSSATESHASGGDLYINLGEISEDILKDGKKSFENGIPSNGDTSKMEETVWGRISKERSIAYAFDSDATIRKIQDVGLNGLSNAEEQQFPVYMDYLQKVQGIVSPEVYKTLEADPAGDDYHYFRGSDYDTEKRSITDRYLQYNNTEGNSISSEDSSEKYDTSAKTIPDVEDVNQDYTLNESERYYQYRISIRPADFKVGTNNITDSRTASVRLRDGHSETVTWYQFKIPISSGQAIGNIHDFKSIRFMRMFLTGFENPVILRFATLELSRGEWRTYTDAIYNPNTGTLKSSNASIEVSAVSIEENANRTPVNYLLPPGISRVVDTSQPQLRQQDEQALSIKLTGLLSGEAKAVYRNTNLDLRHYGKLQMFGHAEALSDLSNEPLDGDISIFIRLGSDYRSNYYEYEIPLKITPHGTYAGSNGQKAIWPTENNLDLDLKAFTTIKQERNRLKNTANSGVTFTQIFSKPDPNNGERTIRVIGNPSLGEIKTLMIGVRNLNESSTRSAEVWVNELRLSNFDEDGGWAAKGNLNVQFSDLGAVDMQGHYESAGFGGLEDGISERRNDNYLQYAVSTNVDVGKLLPKQLKLTAPIYYSYTKENKSPKYNPYDTDVLLDDALESLPSQAARDSLKNLSDETASTRNFSLSNLRFDIQSKHPMPYDPTNFSFSYARSHSHSQSPTTAYEDELDWKFAFSYAYAPQLKSWNPFKNVAKHSTKWLRPLHEINFNFLPQSITYNSDLSRHYYELQLRDVEAISSGNFNAEGNNTTDIPVSFAQQYLWNRSFALHWDLMHDLHLNFTSATQAQIEEPYGVVNKNLYPDEYTAWKDSVRQSLLSLGTPLDYQQTFNASYTLPFSSFPLTDWITANARFASSYNWDRGLSLTDGTEAGNTISNQRTVDGNGHLDFEKLYNKIPWLRQINNRFNGRKQSKPSGTVQRGKEQAISSTMASLSALTKENSVANDTLKSKKKKHPNPSSSEGMTLYENALQHFVRLAMSVRNISFSYRNTYAMSLPGFRPMIGDIFGQHSQHGSGMAPGLAFAFGLTSDSYIQQASENGWLITDNDSLGLLATSNKQEDLQLRINVEPIRDMKIEFSAERTWNRSNEFQLYTESELSPSRHGNFSTSIISISTAFEHATASNGYQSTAFNRFRKNLSVVQAMIEDKYVGSIYPVGTSLAGQQYNASNGGVSLTSAEVMIPAFLSAYTGQDVNSSTPLSIFPSLYRMLPGWRLTYSGLSRLPWIRNYFRNITLTHGYHSTYSIGSYNSYQTYHSYLGDWGFIDNAQNGLPQPSSGYDVSMVSINEQFSPLIGLEASMKNNITVSLQFKKTRVLNLSMTSLQIVETAANDCVAGIGYKAADFSFSHRGKSSSKRSGVNHDLSLRANFTYRKQYALCRDILEGTTQASSGNRVLKFDFTADYQISRLLTLRLYYDRQQTTPLVTTTSYPVTTSDFGLSFRFSLQR